MACPFAKLSFGGKKCPVAKSDNGGEAVIADETARVERESDNGGGKSEAIACPLGFGKKTSATGEADEQAIGAQSEVKMGEAASVAGKCPFGYGKKDGKSKDSNRDEAPDETDGKEETIEAAAGGKCPLGYDSVSFKIGPFSCVLCRALLYDSSRCVPCRHIFCRLVLSSFLSLKILFCTYVSTRAKPVEISFIIILYEVLMHLHQCGRL